MGVVTLNLVAPVAGASVNPAGNLNVQANASSTTSAITGWQVYLDSVQLFSEAQTATSGPIEQAINKNLTVPSNTAIGNHTLQVKAFDSSGAVKVASLTLAVVAAPVAGVITQNVTAPANNSNVNSDGTIHVTANATTTAATITNWEIWFDTVRIFSLGAAAPNIDEVVNAPTGAAVGNHSLIVKCWDNSGTLKQTTLTVIIPSGTVITVPPGTPLGSRTVASLTAHNVTSAANYNQANFPSLFTGNTVHSGTTTTPTNPALNDDSENASSPIVISKESVRNLMPVGWTGRIGMHMQAWWGFTSHPPIGFSDQVQATMDGIIQDFANRGYDLVILDWYSQTGATVANDNTADIIISSCAKAGIKMAIMIDEQYFQDNGFVATTYQSGLITAINHLMDRYAGNPAYEHYTLAGTSRPLMLLWGIATKVGTNVDWTAVRTAVTSHANPLLIQYQAGGFSVVQSDGALGWLDTNADSTGILSGVTYLTSSFLPACKANQSKVCMSSVWKGFNGTLTESVGWSLGKYLNQQAGQTWLDVWAANNAFVAGGSRLDYVCTVTADDFQEGSAVQCGIRTNVAVSASITGNILAFTMTGNENAVRLYNLWGSSDGINAILLASIVPGATKAFDLTALPGLTASGNYTLYLEAQGMPSLESHLAPQTFQRQFTLNVTPPTAVLGSDVISGLAPLTVNFDASGSSDANSVITNYRFDFGDSTPAQSGVVASAQHVYAVAGVYTCTLTVTDANGAVGTDIQVITVGTTPVGPNPSAPQQAAIAGLAVTQANVTTTVYEIPLQAKNQSLTIKLNGVSYKFTIRWNTAAGSTGSWMMDIADSKGKPIISGIPLVTGADLLGQYKYLDLGGQLQVQNKSIPTFANLGDNTRLFFVVTQ